MNREAGSFSVRDINHIKYYFGIIVDKKMGNDSIFKE